MNPLWAKTRRTLKVALRTVTTPLLFERVNMFRCLGYWPHLRKPRSFNEKIVHRKMFAPLANAALLADKLAVRDLVAARCGDSVLSRLYGVYHSPADVPLESLPGPCVIKANNGTGKVVFCDGPVADPERRKGIVKDLEGLYDLDFIRFTHEGWYRDISPRIMVEERLQTTAGEIPSDYKFYVFHGVARFVHVDRNRFSGLKRRIYDMDWNPMPYAKGVPLADLEPAPPNLAKMISVAEAMGKGTDFVRVDLYDLGDRVVFGEVTLAPGAGFSRFWPSSVDFEWGRLW